MKVAVVVFPGSNCDRDCHHAASAACGQPAAFVWHRQRRLPAVDAVVLPGGFSYGDYLRAGAIARQSPIMAAVAEFAAAGGLVLGICNGFQILTEAGLLPGALMRNASLRFECRSVWLRVERPDTPFTCACPGVLRLPIAHMEGNYYSDAATVALLERRRQIVFRYADARGVATPAANPNGSVANIAGVCNAEGNVCGLMPHPERCGEAILGGEDGRGLFASMIRWRR